MTPQRYVMDANILSALLKKEPLTVQRVRAALKRSAELVMCPIVFYEVLRGLLHRDAQRQLEFFRSYSATLTWEDLDRADWEYAASLWADLRARGHPIDDADLLIGAYAARREAVVVTDNTKHFIPLGIIVENWRR
jgi:tRNA(fMet)-specific endonuclease VapC